MGTITRPGNHQPAPPYAHVECIPKPVWDRLPAGRFSGSWDALSLLLLTLTTCALLAATGCGRDAVVKGPTRIDAPEGRYASEGERIAADPVACLHELAERCDALEQYRLMFYRQERLGLISPKLGPMEEIRAAFRKEPFSIKFEWDDPERDYYESVYVAGQNDDKLIARERHGLFPFPAQVRQVKLTDPVTWGRAKNPVTDFGLARLTQRIALLFRAPDLTDRINATYQGLVEIEPIHRPAHHLLIEQTPTAGYTHTRRNFYIDADTLLPAGVDLYLESGQLDARYRYADIDTQVTLTDADFRLSKDHPEEK